MNGEIHKTTNYDMFKLHENNRKIQEPVLKKLMYSIQAHNMLEFLPILVDGNMQVIDGQHRLKAAERLGVPVFYQIDNQATDEDILLLNNNQKIWSVQDYVDYYISKGNIEYIKFQEYAKSKNLSISAILDYAGIGGKQKDNIASGRIRFLTPDLKFELDELLDRKNEVFDILTRYILGDKKMLRSPKLVKALISLLRNKEFDFEVFKKKLILKIDSLRACPDTFTYYSMLRDIYNYKNQNPLN